MRLRLLAGIVAVSFLGLARAGLAQTEPVPEPGGPEPRPPRVAPMPPPGPESRRHPMRPEFLRPEHVTWIGIGVSPVAPVAQYQLKLPGGVGLVVDEVIPDSPAAKAGLQEYDILIKLEDQLLVNPEQLATLVGIHKAGEEITLMVIHEGKPGPVKVTLAEHVGPPMMPMMPRMHPFFGPHGMGGMGPHGMGPGDDREPPHGPPADDENAPPPPHHERHGESLRLTDIKGLPDVELQLDGDRPQVVVKDRAGHTLFTKSLHFEFDTGKGPVNVHVRVGAPGKLEANEPKPAHPPDDRD